MFKNIVLSCLTRTWRVEFNAVFFCLRLYNIGNRLKMEKHFKLI